MALIGIIETGAGNLTSLEAAIMRAGHTVRRLATPELNDIDQLLIPGQGRFGPVMNTLQKNAWVPVLKQWFAQSKPLLGICVGQQVLFEQSEEDAVKGLGLLPGTVKKLQSPKQPMMGWCPVAFNESARSINDEPLHNGDAYFVNSYVVTNSAHAVAYANYGQRFVAAVQHGAWAAFQFHPEKSGAYGEYLLKQYLVKGRTS